MPTRLLVLLALMCQAPLAYAQADSSPQGVAQLLPQNHAVDVNPDAYLKVTFTSAPPLGITGKFKIYDASNDTLVDEVDLSIPPGPKNTRTPPPYDALSYPSAPDTILKGNETDSSGTVYQKNYIGGTTDADAYHFYPVFINGNEATLVPHSKRLQYGKSYYVEVDAEAFPFSDRSFAGITGKTAWTFSTKASPPAASADRVVVAADGTGDFNTVQGAIDYIPDNNTSHKTIFIKNGVYEEIIYFRSKSNFTLAGEDREQVVIRYSNNQPFNPSSGHYKRGVFAEDNVDNVNLVNFTILNVGEDKNAAPIETAAQAEALYVRGDKLQVHNVAVLGSGDALQIQANTRVYLAQSTIRGYGDNLLSYGAAFFNSCELISTYGPHGWPRNSSSSHGDVFLNSTFRLEGDGTSGEGHCDLARAPSFSYPDAEFVLLECKLDGITSDGWNSNKALSGGLNVHYWEYNSVNLSDGTPVDTSKRASYSRQLTMDKDAEIIANYSNPTYVLDGWTPELAPLLLTALPETTNAAPGDDVELQVTVAAMPDATFQWYRDGNELAGETGSSLQLTAVDQASSGAYSVTASNSAGQTTSETVLVVGNAGTPTSGTGGADSGVQDGAVAGGGGSTPGAGGDSSVPVPGAGAPTHDAGAPSGSDSPETVVGVSGSPETGAFGPDSDGGCSASPQRRAIGGAWLVLLAALGLVAGALLRRRGTRS